MSWCHPEPRRRRRIPRRRGPLALLGVTLLVTPLLAQQQPPPPVAEPPHGIEMVDSAPLGGAIAPPLPEAQKRKLKKYDIPELAGARQASGRSSSVAPCRGRSSTSSPLTRRCTSGSRSSMAAWS